MHTSTVSLLAASAPAFEHASLPSQQMFPRAIWCAYLVQIWLQGKRCRDIAYSKIQLRSGYPVFY